MTHYSDSFCTVGKRDNLLMVRPKDNTKHNELVAKLNEKAEIQGDCVCMEGERTIPIEIEVWLRANKELAQNLCVYEGSKLFPPIVMYKHKGNYVSESYLEHVESYVVRYQMNRCLQHLIDSLEDTTMFSVVMYVEQNLETIGLQHIKSIVAEDYRW